MAEPITFGRRRAERPSGLRDAGAPQPLSPRAEAFRQELSVGRPAARPDFSDWWREQQGRRLFIWLTSLALLSPGLLCFLFQTSWSVSVGVEALGVVANWWLRRERRRHLKDIASWEASPAAE